jgi:hypothetical protein
MNQQKFVSELAKLRSSATFLSVMGYRNEHSEVADYSLVFHMSYKNAIKRSIVIMKGLVPSDDLEVQAKEELLLSFGASLRKMAETPEEELQDHFTHFRDDNGSYIKGVKLHTESNTLHLYGLVNHKRVLMPGSYPETNRRPLTITKDRLRRMCPVGKFRSFRMTPNQVDSISVENLSLLPPSV